MIEYGLRVAEGRPGKVQKRGARELRILFDRRDYEDPPLVVDIAELPILNTVPEEERERTRKELENALSYAQNAGPIRRGLAFASILRTETGALNKELLMTSVILGVLEKNGFVDKDPDPQA